LSSLATGTFIKPHPGSISIWGKTIPQKDKAVVRPESKKGGFAHANELVSFIIEEGSFSIGAAGYPQGHIEAP
jgi:hypothetical protein